MARALLLALAAPVGTIGRMRARAASMVGKQARKQSSRAGATVPVLLGWQAAE